METGTTRTATLYRGLAASGGVVFAPVVRFSAQRELSAPKYELAEAQVNAEIARFYLALSHAREQVCALAKIAASSGGGEEIFDSHVMILDDVFFSDTVVAAIRQRSNAEWAVHEAFRQMAETMGHMQDDYMRERVADIHDLRNRLVGILLGGGEQRTLPPLDRPVVLVADNVSPSDAVALPRRYIRGLATEQGSLTAHVSILARALDVPAVVGIGQSLAAIQSGDEVALDGFRGQLWHLPDDAVKQDILAETAPLRAAQEHRRSLADRPAVTPDGVRVTLLANADHSVGFERIAEYGAEGIGLYRTEYLWIGQKREPTEDEQFKAYSEVLAAARQPVTFRVLDIGGDKLVEGRTLEANPFLGNRSVRYLLSHRPVFRAQVRAILRAGVLGDCSLMYPMISTLDELHECREFVKACKRDLAAEHIPYKEKMPEGAMIEVPAAALLAEKLAEQCDFLSVGTNDLVQYTFAVDRGNESVAYLYQPFNPVILGMLRVIVQAARRHNCPVSVCGEMASDPLAAVLLIGMGIHRLSMSANLIPRIKELVCRMAYFDMQRLVDTIFRKDFMTAADVSALCRQLILKYAPDVIKA